MRNTVLWTWETKMQMLEPYFNLKIKIDLSPGLKLNQKEHEQ